MNTKYIYCPYCGTRLTEGEVAKHLTFICKRCKAIMDVSFDDEKINLHIHRPPTKLIISS